MDPRATGIKPAAVVAPHGTSSCPWCSSFWSSLVGSSLRCPYAETCSCKIACFATESDTTIICMTYPNLSSNDCGFNCMVFCMQLFGDRCSCHQILWLEVVLFFWQYNYQVLLFFNHNYLVPIFGHQIYLQFQMFFWRWWFCSKLQSHYFEEAAQGMGQLGCNFSAQPGSPTCCWSPRVLREDHE